MNKGLIDIGLFLEPVSTEGMDYIRIQGSDHWVVTMRRTILWQKRNLSRRKTF